MASKNVMGPPCGHAGLRSVLQHSPTPVGRRGAKVMPRPGHRRRGRWLMPGPVSPIQPRRPAPSAIIEAGVSGEAGNVRIIAALGGNALLRRGEPADAAVQQQHVLDGVRALAPLARDHDLIITHGNGPQVGLLAAESAADPQLSRPYPFDTLTAQTQGMIGYWLLQALANA